MEVGGVAEEEKELKENKNLYHYKYEKHQYDNENKFVNYFYAIDLRDSIFATGFNT